MRRAFTIGVLMGTLLFIALTFYTPFTPIHVANVHAASVVQTKLCYATAQSTSLSCSFSSSVTQGDLLVVFVALNYNSISSSQISVTDSFSDSFTGVAYVQKTPDNLNFFQSEIFYATAASTGSDTITVSLSVSEWISLFIMDAQGYSTSNIVTSTGTGSGSPTSVTSFSPQAGSLVIGGTDLEYYSISSCTPPSGFTCNDVNSGYVFSFQVYDASYGGGSTTLTTSFSGTSAGGSAWSMSAAAFPLATVSQPVVFSVAPSGQPADTITLSGCSVSPTSIPTSDNGVTVTLTAQPSCTITATLSSSSTANTRYVFSGGGTSVSITTCASGTCSTYSATYYYQVSESFAYSVSGGGTGYSAPTLSYTQYGSAASATLSTTATTYWLDAGTSWSVTNPLGGSTSSERWQANANTAGTASAGASVTITYYNQYAFTVSYSVADGGTGYSAPTFSYTQFGSATTYTATTTATTIWVDAGTSWSITNPLSGSSTTERWYTPATTSGTVSAATTVNPTYYNQYYITTSYSISGGGTGYSAPVLTYYYLGTQTTYTETTTATSFWADANSWSITNPLGGSTTTERWYTPTATSGTISGAVTLSFTYYNQYAITASFTIADGGTGYSAPVLSGTQFGSAYSVALSSTQSQVVWLDAGTSWSITNPLSGSSTTERWYTPATTSGTVSGAFTLNPTYYNQYYLTFQLSFANSVSGLTLSSPTVSATQFGSAYTVTVPTTGSVSVWLDATTTWTLNTLVIYQNAAGTQRVATTSQSASVTASTTVTFTYYNQFLVNVQGLNTQYTVFGVQYSATASLTNQWVDAFSVVYTSGDYNYQWQINFPSFIYQAPSGMQLLSNVSVSSIAWNPSSLSLSWTAPASKNYVYVPPQLGMAPASVTDNGVSITYTWNAPLLFFTGSSNFVVAFSTQVINTNTGSSTPYTGISQSTTSYTFITGSCAPNQLPPTPLQQLEQGCIIPAIFNTYAATVGLPFLFIILETLFSVMVFLKTDNPVAGSIVALIFAVVFAFLFPAKFLEIVLVMVAAGVASAVFFLVGRGD